MSRFVLLGHQHGGAAGLSDQRGPELHETHPLPGFEHILEAQARGTVTKVPMVTLPPPPASAEGSPGWYPDPAGGPCPRWWNGSWWTHYLHTDN